ncbi:MAG: 30S ribosomal protein S12 methylthiotransferase RimO [Negativicutes bacterium]
MQKKTVAVVSLGCAKNLVDSELISGLLESCGYVLVDDWNDADAAIINTCGFIDSAKQEAIDKIIEIAARKATNPNFRVIAAGCLAQRYGAELLAELSELDAVVGTGKWRDIPELLGGIDQSKRVVTVGEALNLQRTSDSRIQLTPQHYVYVKVADGCSNRCAFCAIPLIRGKMQSRDFEDVVAEVTKHVANGVKEINLIAQDTTNYGTDLYGRPRLAELLTEICAIEGEFWVRILYCYPRHLTDEIIECMAIQPKICKYIDLPLQHAADEVLFKMLRKDSKDEVKRLIKKLRALIPDVAIRTSFIVGFPGESIADFTELKEFIVEQRFDNVGVFEYSAEEGTVAYEYPEKIDEAVKNERFHQLMAEQSAISEEINRKRVGQELQVLVEGYEDGQAYGRSQYEAPEVDGCIYLETNKQLEIGQWVSARIVAGFAYDLLAEVC